MLGGVKVVCDGGIAKCIFYNFLWEHPEFENERNLTCDLRRGRLIVSLTPSPSPRAERGARILCTFESSQTLK